MFKSFRIGRLSTIPKDDADLTGFPVFVFRARVPIKFNEFLDTLDMALQFADAQLPHSARTNLEEKA
jgi:hypothetical protein